MKNPLTPRVLSIRQPWAWAIVAGHKPVENRERNPGYRGSVLIHAGKSFYRKGVTWLEDKMGLHAPENLPLGTVVGVCVLVDVVTRGQATKSGRWFSGPFGWVFANPRPLPKPIPLKGQLGLYSAPPQLLSQISRQFSS